jgi:hypothetical protein
LQQAEVHAKIGPPKITMTVISLREELIDWYKRHGYIDTRTREFSVSDIHISIVKQPLEFIVLEKKMA